MRKNILCFLYLMLYALHHLVAQEYKLETALQRGHSQSIKCLKYSPDGKYLISGGRDKSIILWQLSTGRQIRTFLGHTSTVNSLDFSPDGENLVSGANDNTVIVWHIKTGKVILKFNDHIERVNSCVFSPEGNFIASGGYDDSVLVWNWQSGNILRKIPCNPDKGLGYGVSLSFSPDGKYLSIGSDNKTTEIWDWKTGEKFKSLRYKSEGWSGGSCNQSLWKGQTLWMASNSEGIYQWNTNSWKTEKVIAQKIEECYNISAESDFLVACMEDEVKLWNIKNNQLLWSIKNDSLKLQSASLSPDGATIAIAGDQKLIQIVSTSTGKPLQTLKGILNEDNNDGLNYDYNSRWQFYIANYLFAKTCFALSADDKYIAKGKVGSEAILIDLATGKIIRKFQGHTKVVLGLEFSLDGKWLLTASGDKTIKLWEVATGKLLQTFKGHSELVFEAKFSKDQKQVISSSWDASIKYWDISTGKNTNTITIENASAYSIEPTNNNAYVISAGLDKRIIMLEPDSKKEVRQFIGNTDVVQTLKLHPEGKFFLSAGWDGKARLWDINSGLQVYKITAHTDKVHSVAFDNTGEQIATGSADRTIKLWETATGKEIATLSGHTSGISCLAFTSDKKTLISQSIDGIIKIWDLKTFKEKATYITIGTKDWIVATPDGYFDATDPVKNYIFFIKGMESYGIDQFFDEFYKPKLMKRLLSAQGTEELMERIIDKVSQFPPPTIEFKNTASNEKMTNSNQTIPIRVIDNGGGIDEVKFMHNGKRIPNSKAGMERGAKKGNSINMFFNIVLQAGLNEIQITGYSKGRVESKHYHKTIYFQNEDKKGNCYIFAVGINQYKNPALNLNYALADANDFLQKVSSQTAPLFKEIKQFSLYDGEATKKNILEQLVNITNLINPEDVFIFFYAGHGSMLNDNFYFIPTDATRLYDEASLNTEAIYAGEMQEILQNIKALKQLMVIDACHSGASAELLAMRGGGEEKAIAQLSRSAGVHILASAGSEQTAGEFKTLGHGIFTYALLNALDGEADGAPKDGKITVYELKSYLDDKVPELTQIYKNTSQYPHTFSKGNDFPLVIKK
ncbi:MAG: hypothetical protein EAZ07_08735 [Cytophagales bacterium]|nr:MAG: hypothetical protein EAZ07_08735 [Cytophagales bacterium]